MRLSYDQKNLILSYLAEKQNWKSLFNKTALDDPKRKWKSVRQTPQDIKADVNPAQTQAYIAKQQSVDVENGRREDRIKAAISIQKEGDTYILEDESGRRYHFGKEPLGGAEDQLVKSRPVQSRAEWQRARESRESVFIEALDAIVQIHENNEKTVYFGALGQKARLEAPAQDYAVDRLPGRFLHAISFDQAAADEWKMQMTDLIMATKLIVAHDLDLEPDIKAFNELEEDDLLQHLLWLSTPEKDDEAQVDHERWRPLKQKEFGDVSPFQKEWRDTTQFAGYYVGLPQKFSLQWQGNGFRLQTELDRRDRILVHGTLLRHAWENETTPINTLATRLAASSLLHMLENGTQIGDHRGRSWNYVVFENGKAADVAALTRQICRDHFGLTGLEFAALSHRENVCLLGMDTEVLQVTKARLSATLELNNMILNNSHDDKRMMTLLDQGANLRMIDEEAVRGGRTFANMMHETGNKKLLKAMDDYSGVRDQSALAYNVGSQLLAANKGP